MSLEEVRLRGTTAHTHSQWSFIDYLFIVLLLFTDEQLESLISRMKLKLDGLSTSTKKKEVLVRVVSVCGCSGLLIRLLSMCVCGCCGCVLCLVC